MDKKTAVLFPGQGCQYVGMGKFLYDHFTEAKLIFEEANDTLGFDIKSFCFAGDAQALTLTENAQPAILAVGYASYRVFQKRIGFIPQFMAGHSLGEYTALTCAEAIRFSDALKIVRKRGELMQEASLLNPGIMVAVSNISSDIVEELCGEKSGGENRGQEDFAIANYNSPLQTVISGRIEKVDKAVHALKGRGADIFPLNVSGPFHSSLMKVSAGKLKEEFQKYTFRKPKVPVISNVDVQVYQSNDEIINGLERQMTSSVRWSEIMLFLAEEGIEIIIDAGPKAIIRNLSLQNSAKFLTYSLDKVNDRMKLREELSHQKAAFIEKALAIAVSEKNSNWDDDEYKTGAVIPYRKVKQLYFKKREKNKFLHTDDTKQAMEMLQKVLHTKKVPEKIKNEVISQLHSQYH